MDVNEALATFFNRPGRKSLDDVVSENTSLVETCIRRFDKANDAKTNLVNKFKSEYKTKNPSNKRSPATTFDFETLWSSTQVSKVLTNERNRVSVALIKASGAEITKKLQVSVAEEEMEENQDTEENSNNREQTLHEEDYDDG